MATGEAQLSRISKGILAGNGISRKPSIIEQDQQNMKFPYSPTVPGQQAPSEFLGMGRSDHICNLQASLGSWGGYPRGAGSIQAL